MTNNYVLEKNAYLVEFPSNIDAKNRRQKIIKCLKDSHGIDESKFRKRRDIDSSLFSGTSISLTTDLPIEALDIVEDAIAVYPIYTVRAPPITMSTTPLDKSNGNDVYSINSHDLTGVKRAHQKLNNYGKGVRVRILQTHIEAEQFSSDFFVTAALYFMSQSDVRKN